MSGINFSLYHHATLFSHEEKAVMSFCGNGRYEGMEFGSFVDALMEAFSKADKPNLDRLAKGFPEYAAAWRNYRMGRLALRQSYSTHAASTCQGEPWWTVTHLTIAAEVHTILEDNGMEPDIPTVWEKLRKINEATNMNMRPVRKIRFEHDGPSAA